MSDRSNLGAILYIYNIEIDRRRASWSGDVYIFTVPRLHVAYISAGRTSNQAIGLEIDYIRSGRESGVTTMLRETAMP